VQRQGTAQAHACGACCRRHAPKAGPCWVSFVGRRCAGCAGGGLGEAGEVQMCACQRASPRYSADGADVVCRAAALTGGGPGRWEKPWVAAGGRRRPDNDNKRPQRGPGTPTVAHRPNQGLSASAVSQGEHICNTLGAMTSPRHSCKGGAFDPPFGAEPSPQRDTKNARRGHLTPPWRQSVTVTHVQGSIVCWKLRRQAVTVMAFKAASCQIPNAEAVGLVLAPPPEGGAAQ
jgi:hypothetical protein